MFPPAPRTEAEGRGPPMAERGPGGSQAHPETGQEIREREGPGAGTGP